PYTSASELIMVSIAALFLASVLPLLCAGAPSSDPFKPPPILHPQPLNITTLAGNLQNESVIECWSVANLVVSETEGIKGALIASLSEPTALNFFNIPARCDGGLHKRAGGTVRGLLARSFLLAI
ncbi:MAG: hypothetical protein Q9171_001718, partial [Xanthocarpia ochracea]